MMEDEILSMESIDSVHLKEALRICEIAGRFRRILQDVPSVAVQGYGPDGTIHFWNSASEQLYYPPGNAGKGPAGNPPDGRDRATSSRIGTVGDAQRRLVS